MLSSTGVSLSNNVSYSNERSGATLETEYAIDAASGFFYTDFKRHDDLKEMLDSNKDSLKLEAMKRIIGMIAKGRDASILFPAVVKNVVSKNIELKKLVYVYLERYAEEQQDLALLSISTFQRALKEPNQLIRAGALRVLSSIRVSMITPIVMLAIRDASADMSPYVRKTAAHAIPKIYSLDNEQKPELILIIQKLLADRTVLVIGSAVMAFTKVCPERVELIHQVFRKLCMLLVDVDEWGQVIIINMLTRYARTQFSDPNKSEKTDIENLFYESGSDSSEKPAPPALDPDHRLLLRSARPLLQSRNAAVVMAVAQLYHHTAPKSEQPLAARALVRLLRSHTEVQSIVLNTIASISFQKKGLFEPYLTSFFVRTSDPTGIKLLKLDILTNLATDANVSVILRELQTYISSSDKQFVAASIQAIGRCACSISEITDSCLNGLVSLLSNRDEAVVAESVVVIKKLLQTRAAEPKDIVIHMVKLLDSITVPQARAAILWLLGEHSISASHIAPDVLRKLAKTFSDEHDIVKLQVLNLAVKLHITHHEQVNALCQYIFNLARYDQNYDIRDRARFLKHFTNNTSGKLVCQAARIFLVAKPAPLLQSQFKDREQLQLGSLSHYINARAIGYEPLPSFPSNPPPSSVRDVELVNASQEIKNNNEEKDKEFSWESEDSYETDRSISSSDKSDSSSSTGSGDENSETEESSDAEKKDRSSSNDSDSDSSSSEASTSEQSIEENKISKETKTSLENEKNTNKPPSNLDLLLGLYGSNEIQESTPVMSLTPLTNSNIISATAITPTNSTFVPNKNIELLNRINGRGLSITYKYSRTPHLFSKSMVNIALTFTNNSSQDIVDVRIGQQNLSPGLNLYEFANIKVLGINLSLPATLGIDFNDSTALANFEIVSSIGTSSVCIKPSMGELVRPVTVDETFFLKEQARLKGMNEHSTSLNVLESNTATQKVLEHANVGCCQSSKNTILRFAAQTLTSSSLILITLQLETENTVLTVNCEKMVIGSILLSELKAVFK